MNKTLKKGLCLLLSLVLLAQAAPITKASAAQVSLPEVELPEEVRHGVAVPSPTARERGDCGNQAVYFEKHADPPFRYLIWSRRRFRNILISA